MNLDYISLQCSCGNKAKGRKDGGRKDDLGLYCALYVTHTEDGIGALDHLFLGWDGQNKLIIIQIIAFFKGDGPWAC